jgi:hypothetical protein
VGVGAITLAARVCQYVKIYVPAAVVSASDWWRVAAIGAVALTLGDKDLAVFNSSYRLLWLANIFNGSLSGAAAVKLGIALGAGQARRARALCVISCSLVRHRPRARPPAWLAARRGQAAADLDAYLDWLQALVITCCMAVFILVFARELGGIFSNDPELLDMYGELALPLAAMLLTFSMACFLERIPMAMGRTRLVMQLGLVGSWVGQVRRVVESPCLGSCTHGDSIINHCGAGAGGAHRHAAVATRCLRPVRRGGGGLSTARRAAAGRHLQVGLGAARRGSTPSVGGQEAAH